MKRFQHFITALIVLTALLCCLSVTAFADDSASGTCGDNVTWALNSKGLLTISGTGKMSSAPWRDQFDPNVIKAIVIEDGVTTIASHAFRDCTAVTELVIPDSVTTVGYWSLMGLSLDKLVIPTSLVNYDTLSMNCHTVDLYISDLELFIQSCKSDASLSFDNLYLNNEQITHLVIPDSVTYIPASSFASFSSLESLTIPDSVTEIGDSAFYGCKNLKTVKLSESLTSIPYGLFRDCKSLESITFPASTLTIASEAIHYCDSLNSIRFMGNAPLIASNAFNGITATVYYSADDPSWTEDMLQNYGGKNITWQVDPSIPPASAESTIAAQGTCGDNVTWTLSSKGLLTISGTGKMSSAPWRDQFDPNVIKAIVIEDGVTTIASHAFRDCTAVTELVIPDSVTTVGYWSLMGLSLDKLVIPTSLVNYDTLSMNCHTVDLYISDLELFIQSCKSDASLSFDNLYLNNEQITHLVIPDSVTYIPASSFASFSSLESLTIPDSVTEIGDSAFYGCKNLKTVKLSESLTSIPYGLFRDCKSLESITFPASTLTIASEAIHYCDSLNSIRFMGNAPLIASTAFNNITAAAYYSAENTTWSEDMRLNYGGSITWIPDSSIPSTGEMPEIYTIAYGTCGDNVYWVLTSDGKLYVSVEISPAAANAADFGPLAASVGYTMDDYASAGEAPWAAYADQIKSVVVADSITSIGDNAFADLPNLKKVVISEDVAQVGSGAFAGCEALAEVSFAGDAPEIGDNAFEGSTVTVTYPADNDSWNNDVLANAGGSITMKPVETVTPVPTPTPEATPEPTPVITPEPTPVPTPEVTPTPTPIPTPTPEPIENPFTDVTESDWYFNSVMWAKGSGVTGGKTETTFAPNENCTRAQVVTFLWAANGKPEPASMDNPFTDVSDDAWYLKPVLWAVEQGITSGVAEGKFGPNQTCTRAQVVTFLYAAAGKPAVSDPIWFTDVRDDDWFTTPVIWAVENDVTSGIGNNRFGPNNTCTRGQVVTFLYKVYG